jgi:hypothetical protein
MHVHICARRPQSIHVIMSDHHNHHNHYLSFGDNITINNNNHHPANDILPPLSPSNWLLPSANDICGLPPLSPLQHQPHHQQQQAQQQQVHDPSSSNNNSAADPIPAIIVAAPQQPPLVPTLLPIPTSIAISVPNGIIRASACLRCYQLKSRCNGQRPW